MRISCSSCVMADLDLRGALARMKELGFRYFDLFALEGMGHVYPSRLAADGGRLYEEVVGAVRESGLEVSSVNCGFSRAVNDPSAEACEQVAREFGPILDLAEEVGAPIVTLQTGGYGTQVGRVESFDRAMAGLGRLVEAASGRDVRLSFEPHSGAVVEKPADALYMVKRLWPGAGITYDPSHFAMQPDIESLAETEGLLEYTTHVHVRNAALGEMQAPMDEGTVDFGWVVEALRGRGYAGAVAIEYLYSAEADAIKLRDVLVELGIGL